MFQFSILSVVHVLQACVLQALPPVLSESNKEVSDVPENIAASDSTQDIPELTMMLLTVSSNLGNWMSDAQICRAWSNAWMHATQDSAFCASNSAVLV